METTPPSYSIYFLIYNPFENIGSWCIFTYLFAVLIMFYNKCFKNEKKITKYSHSESST